MKVQAENKELNEGLEGLSKTKDKVFGMNHGVL